MSQEKWNGVATLIERILARLEGLESRLTDLEKQVEEHRKRWLE